MQEVIRPEEPQLSCFDAGNIACMFKDVLASRDLQCHHLIVQYIQMNLCQRMHPNRSVGAQCIYGGDYGTYGSLVSSIIF